jgi:hypothetical protein
MRHDHKIYFSIFIIYLFSSCGSQNTTTGGVKITGESKVSGSVITGSNNVINQYERAVEIRNYYKESVERDEKNLDSIYKAIMNLEAKLSVFNESKVTEKESKLIRKNTLELKRQADSISKIKVKHEEKLRLQNILMEDLEARKNSPNNLSKKNTPQDSLKIKANTFTQDSIQNTAQVTPSSTTTSELPKMLISSYERNSNIPISLINKNITRYNDSITSIESTLTPLRNEQSVGYTSLKYAERAGNIYTQERLKRDMDERQSKIRDLQNQLRKYNIEKGFNEYLNTKTYYNQGKKVSSIKNILYPKTGKEFLEALKNDTKIVLSEKEYNISPSEVGKIKNPNISFYEYFQINNLKNVEIIGINESETHIYSNIINLPVLILNNVQGINIQNLKLGHNGFLREEYISCGPGGDVIQLQDSYDIHIEGVSMYGCGTQGIEILNSGDITIKKSKIYDCTNGVVSLWESYNILFEDCSFNDNLLGYRSIFDIVDSKNIYINNLLISNNKIANEDNQEYRDIKVFSNFEPYEDIFVENTIIENNVTDYFTYQENSIKENNVVIRSNNIYRKSKYQPKD